MTEIKKKTWPEFFQKILDGKKNAELRLADFEIKEGDTLILEEFNPETNSYTGRKIEKKVKNVTKIRPAEFYSMEDIKNKGLVLMEMEDIK
ncbi:DUF3850 domain-containing protein [Candidatus Pacearchaeota archaeon]|nr:DUF3850 domain-containing protein [Candidatus Pacearchaeota archaeon]